eukprot:Plantae.Rhodophyta-Purpureofilum_apyrenoidigerum.ctg6863.p1 GENE.Plantae.Rhodophyta-Purpureofilum_apyrenoidigerum.ctg6863~~Plantae.Rhodophyta-Purpureofilum_apyrenoidigerum.ctg6863.p1  ORF type:complete len:208 (-),score=30.90 Plantae.Rhodophyta-Purpureofilum_apyrenoidigerum.ctg6863:414-1037(-)
MVNAVDSRLGVDPTQLSLLSPFATPLFTCLLRLRIGLKGGKVSPSGSLFLHDEKQNAVGEFVSRLRKRTGCSYSSVVLAFLYIDKLRRNRVAGYQLTLYSFRRMLCTSVMIASKFVDDNAANNRCFAAAADVPLGVINRLERKMLGDLNFDLHVSVESFAAYETRLFFEAMSSEDLSALQLKITLAEKGLIPRRLLALQANSILTDI